MNKPMAGLAAMLMLAGLLAAAPARGLTDSLGTASTTRVPLLGSAGSTPTIHWKQCPGFLTAEAASRLNTGPDRRAVESGHGIKCANLKVPLDYAKPHGRTITLALTDLFHTSSAANFRGVMLSNPGGPGGSGLDLGPYLADSIPHNVGDDYDWVSWDPRGVGSSRPRISCKPGYFNSPRRSYDPTSHSLLRYWLQRSKSYAHACEKRYPALLKNMTTVDTARDMESIRRAVGVTTISYYGYSYGTYLGQVYSTLYPHHLFRMVLDSNVDPRRVWYQANLGQDRAFDRNITIYFHWLAKYHSTYHLGATAKSVTRHYYRQLAALKKHPTHGLGPDEFNDAMQGAPYYESTWKELANAWRHLDAGHPASMISEYENSDSPGDDNGFAVYNAVQCTDVQWPTHWSRWRRDAERINRKHPFFTWNNNWFNAPCLFWGAKAHTPLRINGSATKSVLLIDEKLDAATPYEGSLEVRKLYPNSSLIAEPDGTTHADSLSGDACVDDQVATYLLTGKRPPRKAGRRADTTCKPLPRPEPR